jgi:hypothetical protein
MNQVYLHKLDNFVNVLGKGQKNQVVIFLDNRRAIGRRLHLMDGPYVLNYITSPIGPVSTDITNERFSSSVDGHVSAEVPCAWKTLSTKLAKVWGSSWNLNKNSQ